MIPQTDVLRQANTVYSKEAASWQKALADIIRDPVELMTLLELNTRQAPASLAASNDFALKVPRAFVNRIEKDRWDDPLLLQVLPQPQELDHQPGFIEDPLEEIADNPVPGLIHKYQGRVLLVVSGGCAINCRYCFRRHFPYQDNNPSSTEWQQTLNYIEADSSIREVILSGGDPLAASNRSLNRLVSAIAEIEHVHTLRIHSRMPIVIPERIDQGCIDWMSNTRLNTVMVVHCNHANEIDSSVAGAMSKLQSAGITLLNQSVLLAGVNDKVSALVDLSEKLFSIGVLPYYLHLLDKVQGAAHFNVTEHQAQSLMADLLSRLPGYLVPRLVSEQPGALSKVPVKPLVRNSPQPEDAESRKQ